MNFEIVSATAGMCKHTLLYKSFPHLNWGGMIYLNLKEYNTEPLAKVYNNAIDSSNADFLIFCHDDISIEDNRVFQKIIEYVGEDSQYSICGLAGSTKCIVGEKNLWHLMAGRNQLSGAVGHYTQDGEKTGECFMTNFGVTPQRCILLDGLFIAVNLKKIKEVGLRFDENNPSGFHFYDLHFCLEANRLGLKMTTAPIWVVHRSHGLQSIDDKSWKEGNEYFKSKWNK